jgi:ankyrin repeat protein
MDDDPFDGEELHFAADNGDVQRIRELIAAGCDPNSFDSLGKTPLHYAAQNECFAAVEFLIQAGANVNAHDERSIGNTPLGEVAGECSLRMAQLLVEAGADPTIPGWMQLTALHRAQGRYRDEGRAVMDLLAAAAKKLGR